MHALTEPSQRNDRPLSGTRRPRRLVSGWALALSLYILLVPTHILEGRAAVALTDIAWTLAALLASISCVRAALVLRNRDRLAWMIFGAASGMWTLGQIVWTVYELALKVPLPFPSEADIGYLAFGPLMIFGLLVLRSTQMERKLTWHRLANLGLILCGLAAVLIAMFMHPFSRAEFSSGSSIIIVVESASVAVAFIVALYVLWSYQWGDRFESTALVTISLALQMVAALFYTREIVVESYGVHSMFNAVWLFAFAIQQWAGESQVWAVRHGDVTRARAMQEKQGWVEALVPSVLLLCICIAVFAVAEELTPRTMRFGALVIAVFAIVLALRESMLYARGQQIQAQLATASVALADSRRQLAEMAEHRLELQRDIDLTARAGAVGLWDWELGTSIVHFTPEWKHQLGYRDEEIKDDIEEWRTRVHPEDRERIENAIDAYLAKPRGEFVAEQRLRHRNGTYRWILVQGSILLDAQGRPQRMLGSHVDITARKEGELSLQESEQRYRELVGSLESRVEARTRELTEAYRESQSFSYAVAHDLKAPLRAIDGFSHLLEQSAMPRLNEHEQEYIRRVRRGAIHMSSLIDGLLAYSHLEHRELHYRAIDCQAFMTELLQSLEPTIQAAGATINVTAPHGQVWADVEGLRIVLRNLLDNALKFTSPARTPRIDIECRTEQESLVISVRDNGIGFDPQYHDKIFEIFNRLHSSGYAGTGIGLALVRKAVHRMRGRIWAESALDQGATFFVSLPIVRESSAVTDTH